nr:outer membrane lipoprotein carrier protein LolA [uncultured Treponema sp.]
MKKIIVFAAVFFASILSFSQNLSIESVCADLSKNKITRGNFGQEKTIGKNGRVIKSFGEFIFAPEGIVWNTKKPFSSTLILGEDYMIQMSSDGTKNVMDAKGNEVFKSISSTLLAVFSNHVSKLHENFNVVFRADSDKWWVTLEPKDSTVASIMAGISLSGKSNSENTEISTVELNEAKGSKVSYTFFDQSYPKELKSDEKILFDRK